MKKIGFVLTAVFMSVTLTACSGISSLKDIIDRAGEIIERIMDKDVPISGEPVEIQYYDVEYIRTGFKDGAQSPMTHIATKSYELCMYGEAVAHKYDDDFFDRHSLLIVRLTEGSGSIRHRVDKVDYSLGVLYVNIARLVPEIGTCDMAQWDILITIDDSIPPHSPVIVEISKQDI